MWKKIIILLIALLSIEGLLGQIAQGKDYPVKPVEFITFQAAGSGFDIMSRILAERFSKYLGQPTIVVNKPGGAGSLAAADIINSKPDGYKLFVHSTSFIGLTVKTQKVSFDPWHLVPIATFAEWVNTFYVKGDSAWNSLNDLIKYGKENPGKLRWAHPGKGLSLHVIPYMLFSKAGVETIDLPYKGSAEMVAALLGGHVDAASGPYTPVKENVRAKQIRVLVTWGDQRFSDPSDVPCHVELGFPKAWTVPSNVTLYAHKDTPQNIKDTLIDISRKIYDEEFKKAIEKVGAQPRFSSTEQANKIIKNTEEICVPILKELGLYVER